MFTSPITGVSTTDDNPVTLIPPVPTIGSPATLAVWVEGWQKCFVSADGGASWFPVLGSTGPTSLTLSGISKPMVGGVLLRRPPGGTNVTGAYAAIY